MIPQAKSLDSMDADIEYVFSYFGKRAYLFGVKVLCIRTDKSSVNKAPEIKYSLIGEHIHIVSYFLEHEGRRVPPVTSLTGIL